MPYLQIQTNIPAAKIPDDFLRDSTKLLSEMLQKPESYICVCIEPGQLMTWGGTKEPTAFAQLCNLGNHNPESTQRYTEVLSKFLVDKLGISQQRMYIFFPSMERFEVGYNGKTFA